MAFTYFFRDKQTLDLIVEHAIPELKRRRYINVWDAGSANGPEPYTLAIILRENMGHFLFRNVKIYATDVDESNLFGDIIERGIYSDRELKRIPKPIFEKYFSPDGSPDNYQINEELRRAVTYQRHNLLSLEPIREGFGLIMCKNVLLHFKPEQRIQVIRMYHRALSPEGYFVTEQTQKLPEETKHLFRRVTHAGQVFQKV